MDFKKNYNLYFHHDFDGIASGAVILNFLKTKGGDIRNFYSLNHFINFKKWSSLKLKKPAIIFDFFFHPDAEIWFDHHKTTFTKKEWQKKFKETKLRRWNPKSPSTCSFLMKHLQNNFYFKPAPFLKELDKWTDIIDSGGYKSIKQVFDLKIPAMKICFSQDEDCSLKYREFLIKELSRKSMEEVIKSARVEKLIKRYKNKFHKSIRYFRNNFEVFDRVGFLKIEKNNLIDFHFISFYLNPQIDFSVVLIKKRGYFKLHADINPWHKSKLKKQINIGEFLRKNYGGGGHSYVGGAAIKNKTKALKSVQEIIKYLNEKG